MKNQTGKSRDFSKYPGIHPGYNRDPGKQTLVTSMNAQYSQKLYSSVLAKNVFCAWHYRKLHKLNFNNDWYKIVCEKRVHIYHIMRLLIFTMEFPIFRGFVSAGKEGRGGRCVGIGFPSPSYYRDGILGTHLGDALWL